MKDHEKRLERKWEKIFEASRKRELKNDKNAQIIINELIDLFKSKFELEKHHKLKEYVRRQFKKHFGEDLQIYFENNDENTAIKYHRNKDVEDAVVDGFLSIWVNKDRETGFLNTEINEITKFLEQKNNLEEIYEKSGEIKLDEKILADASPEIKRMLKAFSYAIKFVSNKKDEEIDIKNRENEIGERKIKESNEFAKKMGKHIERVKKEGFTSSRKIAARFNELGIPSARGGKWTHDTVLDVINRRKDLGLEPSS